MDLRRALAAALKALVVLGSVAAASPPPAPPGAVDPLTLAQAPKVERLTLERLTASPAWPRRALAAMRLERYEGPESRNLLVDLLGDEAWQVRAYATSALGRRAEPAEPGWFATEDDGRVLRTALRYRYHVDATRLARGVNTLARSRRLDDKMLAAELGAASGDAELAEIARDAIRTTILRMSRAEAGSLSPRLAAVTGRADLRRRDRWQQWLLKTGRGLAVEGAFSIDAARTPLPPSPIATIDPESFAALVAYIERLAERAVDLAICIDCTASMSGELNAAQAGLDDLILFVGDVVGGLRIGLVAYRDRGSKFQTKGWDLTDDFGEARRHLWQLSAEGGGDRRELVYDALKLAFTKMSWDEEHTRVLVLVGDAPPHVGFGAKCVELAKRGAEVEITTHAIEAAGKPVEHFAEIAEAGGGRTVALEDDDLLMVEIAGLSLGDAYTEEVRTFFRRYLAVCR